MSELDHLPMDGYASSVGSARVVEFLSSLGLPPQWTKVIVDNGFDDMETLIDIEESDMRELGLPAGHIIKVRKGVRLFYAQQQEDISHVIPHGQPAGWISAPTLLQHCSSAGVGASACNHIVQSKGSGANESFEIPDKMRIAVQHSWKQVRALGSDVVGEVFSQHLFEIAPETHARCGMEWAPVVNGIGYAVDNLSNSEATKLKFKKLGKSHCSFGVQEHEFREMGEAFILALRSALGQSLTREAEEGWTEVYRFVSGAMLEGMR